MHIFIFVWDLSCAEHYYFDVELLLCEVGFRPPNINKVVYFVTFYLFSFIFSCICNRYFQFTSIIKPFLVVKE